MNYLNYYTDVLKKYAVFSGRANRAEYWYFVLINFLIGLVISFVEGLINTGDILGMIYSLAVLLPSLGVAIRRLHDVGKSGWWLLIALIPIAGIIWLIVLLATDSTAGDNKYGPNVKGSAPTPTPPAPVAK